MSKKRMTVLVIAVVGDLIGDAVRNFKAFIVFEPYGFVQLIATVGEH